MSLTGCPEHVILYITVRGRPLTITKEESMRFITIEEYQSTERVLVNVAQISSITSTPTPDVPGYQRVIKVNMSDGNSVSTKFTSVENAVDYIQRASSVSLGGV